MEVDSQSWIIDSGSTKHICSSFQMLSSSREFADGECSMVVGNGADLSAVALGVVCLELGNKFLVLNNVYCIPGFRRNLISVSKLYEQLFTVSFDNNQIVISRTSLYPRSYHLERHNRTAWQREEIEQCLTCLGL